MRTIYEKHISADAAYVELAGPHSELSSAPKIGIADGSKYECTDSSNVGKVYTFSEADGDWNYQITLSDA